MGPAEEIPVTNMLKGKLSNRAAQVNGEVFAAEAHIGRVNADRLATEDPFLIQMQSTLGEEKTAGFLVLKEQLARIDEAGKRLAELQAQRDAVVVQADTIKRKKEDNKAQYAKERKGGPTKRRRFWTATAKTAAVGVFFFGTAGYLAYETAVEHANIGDKRAVLAAERATTIKDIAATLRNGNNFLITTDTIYITRDYNSKGAVLNPRTNSVTLATEAYKIVAKMARAEHPPAIVADFNRISGNNLSRSVNAHNVDLSQKGEIIAGIGGAFAIMFGIGFMGSVTYDNSEELAFRGAYRRRRKELNGSLKEAGDELKELESSMRSAEYERDSLTAQTYKALKELNYWSSELDIIKRA